VPQPNWQDDLRDFKKFGKPNLFFGVTSGNMDSMVNHYTANKRLRSNDAYTPGGEKGLRPDNAVTVYSQILKELFPDTPLIIGGIEASMRRMTHYHYWSDSLKPSILYESGADLLLYGMAEEAILEILTLLRKNIPFKDLSTVPQTAYLLNSNDEINIEIPKKNSWQDKQLHSHNTCLKDKKKYAENFRIMEESSLNRTDIRLIQEINGNRLVINPPFSKMTTENIDKIYSLPYTRLPHPRYKKRGKIPAYEMIRHSVTSHRGCFGGCSFCTISLHQGRNITSRSQKSILNELKIISEMEDFKGYISDIGGPTANMYEMSGINTKICDNCRRTSCIYPEICKNLNYSHKPLIELYKKGRALSGIKKISISSGIRYDLFTDIFKKEDAKGKYLEELIKNHTSGRLKVAPEHTEEKVLSIM
ncbi:MAG: YgiQ family radical SAM protein, partial [Actinomycetia bacterium]|nr:YgiQ family radical SAM protein [Actinomycetes bacterium]